MVSVKTEAIKGLQNLSECCICLTTYRDPRILPCLHTCCLKCLEDIQSKSQKKLGENLLCPLCRNEFTIPPEGMNGLRKNFFIENLIAMTKTLDAETTSIPCSSCSLVDEEIDIPEATVKCLNCCESYCRRCSKIHTGQKLTKDHKIIEMSCSLEDEEIRNMFPVRNCNKHLDKELDYYCGDCEAVVCISCFVEDHRYHECKDVKTVDSDFRKKLEERCASFSDCLDQMLSKKADIIERQKDFAANILEKEKAIRSRGQKLKALIDQDTKILLDELSFMQQRNEKITEMKVEEIGMKLAVLENFITYCTELKLKGSPTEICCSIDNLFTRAKEISAENDEYLNSPTESVEVDFIETRQNIGNVVGKLSESTRRLESHAILFGVNNRCPELNKIIGIDLHRPETVSRMEELSIKIRMEAAAAVYGESVFVSGIGNSCDEIWEFNTKYSKWIKCPSMFLSRKDHSVAFVDHVLYICGGYDEWNQRLLDDVEAYDTNNHRCKMVGKLVYAVHNSGNCVPFRDTFYIFGGVNSKDKALGSVQVYDTQTNACSLLPKPMPKADSFLRASVLKNSVILIGYSSCFIYHFDTDTWQRRDQFQTDVREFSMIADNGKIFIIGGAKFTTDAGGKNTSKWVAQGVKYLPIANILNDEATEWKHHSKLPKHLMIRCFGAIKSYEQYSDSMA